MMYLIVVVIACALFSLFLIVERHSLTAEKAVTTKKLNQQKRQVHGFRQAYSATIRHLQQQLQYQYVSLEFDDSKEQAILKFFLDKLPAVMQYQAESGLPHKKAMLMIDDSSGVPVVEQDKFFKTQGRELQRLWQSSEADALLELTLLMMQRRVAAMKNADAEQVKAS